MKKNFLILLIIIVYFLSGIYAFRISIYENLPINYQAILKVIFSNKINTKRLNNDYNIKFLPETQFSYINFNKVDLKLKNVNYGGYGNFIKRKSTKTFFVDIYNNNIIITLANGDIFRVKTEEILKNQNNIKKINTNIKSTKILDSLIHEDYFIATGSERITKNCKKFVIFKGKINLDKLTLKKKYLDNNCYKTIQSGRVQFDKKLKGLIISTAADILKFKDQNDNKPQDPNSLMGKIILYNFETQMTKIISKGHRNILGLLSTEGIILSTENGPKGGDEINLIELGENYGWPLASYGEKYRSLDNNELNYLKSHYDNGFKEPIYSFVPSIGSSEIIKLNNSFSKYWQNNFIFGSLNSRHLYRVKFDKNFNKVLYIEKIFIGERIRDLKFLSKSNIILMSLEDTGSIGILSSE